MAQRLTPSGDPYNYDDGYVFNDIQNCAFGLTCYWGYDAVPGQYTLGSGFVLFHRRTPISAVETQVITDGYAIPVDPETGYGTVFFPCPGCAGPYQNDFSSSGPMLACTPSFHSVVTVDVAPFLSVTLSNETVVISWPAPAPGWQLEYATQVVNGTNAWSVIPAPYSTNATQSFFTEPLPTGCKFYRLHKP